MLYGRPGRGHRKSDFYISNSSGSTLTDTAEGELRTKPTMYLRILNSIFKHITNGTHRFIKKNDLRAATFLLLDNKTLYNINFLSQYV